MSHNWIVPYSNVPKLNCALIQCLIFGISCQRFGKNLCLIPTSPFWIVPKSNLNVFLIPLDQLCLIPWALVLSIFRDKLKQSDLFQIYKSWANLIELVTKPMPSWRLSWMTWLYYLIPCSIMQPLSEWKTLETLWPCLLLTSFKKFLTKVVYTIWWHISLYKMSSRGDQ